MEYMRCGRRRLGEVRRHQEVRITALRRFAAGTSNLRLSGSGSQSGGGGKAFGLSF